MPGPGHILDVQLPEVNPSGASSANRMDIQASPGMFGAFGAQAAEHVGQAAEKAGEEGMGVLIARQQLVNETHASELNTWLANRVTDKYSAFNRLEGRAAQDALPAFKKDLNDLYQEHMDQAGDNLALRAQLAKNGRYLTDAYNRYATNWADQQFHTWQDKTATARATTYGTQAMVAYKSGDTNGMEIALNTSDDEVRKLFEQRGWDHDAIDAVVLKNRGHNLRNIIVDQSYDNPIAASGLYRKYEHQMDEDSSRETKAAIYGRVAKAIGDDVGSRALRDTYQTVPAAPQAQPVLDQAAARYGLSSSYLTRTWQIESGSQFNPPASSTGARGPFQFTRGTAAHYGLTDPNDFGQSAEATAHLAADNRTAMMPALQRAPTDAELYLAHQQGSNGALKLLLNPNTRAGDLVGDQAIRVNGGNPDAPAAEFTGMWSARYAGAGAIAAQSRKSAAYQTVASNPNLSPDVRDHAIARINREVAISMQAQEETQQQRTLRDQDASNEYVSKLLTGAPIDLNAMANDPRLLPNTKVHLYDLAQNKGLTDDPASFGPKYADTYGRIVAPASSPDRITSAAQILQMGAPGGGLTLKGVDRLMKVYTEMSNQKLGEHDPVAVNTTKAMLLKYAQETMARQQLIPGMGTVTTNIAGERVFNSQFGPMFEASYEKWIKDGKNPWEFLTKKNVEAMIEQVYPKAQRDRDMISSGEQAAQVVPPGGQEMPAAPQGIDKDAWTGVIQRAPITKSGRQWPYANWAAAVNDLRSNPAPDRIAAFDAHFAPSGITAKDVLDRLNAKPAANAAAEIPAEATSPAAGEAPSTQLPPRQRQSYWSPSGPGPATYLGDLIRAVTPTRVQEYVRESGR